MKKYFLNLKLIKKFGLIFSVILIAIIASFAVILRFYLQQQTFRAQVNVAGSTRMLSQRIGAMALLINSDDEKVAEAAKKEAEAAINRLDKTLSLLKEGGWASVANEKIEFPPAPDAMAEKIFALQNLLGEYKKIIEVLLIEPRKISV